MSTSTTLDDLLTDINTLPPSERKARLVAFALRHLKGDQPILRQELDAKLSTFNIIPKDYALLLHTTQSLPWALDVLKTSPHVSIITTAVDIIGKAWRKDPLAVQSVFGEQSEIIVQLIDTTLPRHATARLFRLLGRAPHLSPAHSATVDNILRAIFPFLSDDSPSPISRYARTSLVALFAAASPSVLMAIIQRCAGWLNEGTWKELARCRPELVEQIYLQDRSLAKSGASLDDLIIRRSWNQGIIWALLRKQKDSTFFTRFLDQYISQTLQDKDAPDVFGAHRAARPSILVPFIAFILRKRTDPSKVFQTALTFCESLAKLVDAGACDEWTWDSVRPLLHIACEKFGRSPDQWTLQSVSASSMETETSDATRLLLAIFKRQSYSNNNFSNPSSTLIYFLRCLPLPARLPFLDLLYATKTSESLLGTPSNRFNYPSFSAFLLSLLYPAHGRILLEIGIKAREQQFICTRWSYQTASQQVGFIDLWHAGAASPILLANWAGRERSALGDRAADLGQADDGSIRDVEMYKQRAICSRDNRFKLTTTALSIALFSRSPTLFVDTFLWAIKRYAKDPDTSPALLSWIANTHNTYILQFLSGPVGLYVCHATRHKLTKDMLLAWCLKTNEIFDALMYLLSVWVHEPSYASSIQTKYNSVGSLLLKVIQERTALIDKVFPFLLDNLDDLGEALLIPLVEHWMKWERFKVQEHPDILGFNAAHNTPNKNGTLEVHLRILPVIFSFIEKLTSERESLYREGRLKLLETNINVDYQLKYLQGGSRHILPFDLDITGTKTSSGSHRGIHLPQHISSYVESVVGDPAAILDKQNDRLDWHPTQFREALESYIVYSKDKEEIDRKILDLLHRYEGADGQPDLRCVVLRSPEVQSLLWDREVLNNQVRSWLPQYPAIDGSQDIDFNPLPLMPPKMDTYQKDASLMVALREPEEEKQPMLDVLLSPLNSWYNNISIRGASINTTQRLAIFLIAWILTMLKVPRDGKIVGDGPVHYTIRKVRLSQAFIDAYNKSNIGGASDLTRSTFPCRMLHLVLPSLSLPEVDDFARAVFSVPKTPTSEAISLAILGAVRSLGVPRLVSEQAFSILEDVEASSWHRQAITPAQFHKSRPQEARELMDRVLVYTQKQHRQQKARRQTASTVPSGMAPEPLGPLLKMSTHKMAMQLLQIAVQLGSIDASFVEEWANTGLLDTPSPIISYVVDILVGMVQDSFVMARGADKSGISWKLLMPYVIAAQRLNEEVPFSETQWAAARLGQIPMPDIVEERHIASSLLSRDTFSLPPSLKQAWAKNVVEPVIVGHIESRTRWLKTAVAREGGNSELEATMKASYGNGMPVITSFKTFVPHLPPPETSLLRLLEHEALGFLSRDSCQKLRNLMEKNHPAGWKLEKYGKNVVQLTSYAVSDTTQSGSSAMSAIAEILSMPNMPLSLLEDVTSCLKRIGSTLLKPDHMSIHADLHAVVPFSSFKRFVTSHLAAPSQNSLEPRIVTLLSDFLATAVDYEKQKSSVSFNGGACYWHVILILKLLSLRIATNMPNDNNASVWIENRALSLAELAKHVADRGWYHVHFPQSFESYLRLPRVQDVIPVCLALTSALKCPEGSGWLRVLCFDTAVMLLRAQRDSIEASPTARRQLAELSEVWKKDMDGAVGWLSLSWHDKEV